MKKKLIVISALCYYALITSVLAQTDANLIAKWKVVLNEPPPPANNLAARNEQSKQKAQAAIQLYRNGKFNEALILLKSAEDPAARSYFIRDLGTPGTSPYKLIHQLTIAQDPSVRRALIPSVRRAIILCLGGFDSLAISRTNQLSLTNYLLQQYRNDPDPGIHSAIDWLLRYGQQGLHPRKLDWQQSASLQKIDSELTHETHTTKNWICTSQGQTLAVINGPVNYIMGTPNYEPGRDKTEVEAEHLQQIPRSFAIATKEVTIAQFQRFLDANPDIKNLAKKAGLKDPSRDGAWMQRLGLDENAPQIFITWFEAAQYCNWLSEQDGIPENQWCYPTLKEIKEGMTLPVSYLHRTGYRLPTEAEWQYACRSGTTTMRSFGDAEELLPEYAWFSGNTFNQRPLPVGQLKPNDFGLFDMYGNVWEWGQDLIKSYKTEPKDSTWVDGEDIQLIVSKDYKRPRLGGSYTYSADYLRSGYRNEGYIPDERRDNVGFRIAKTMNKNSR